MAHGDAREGKWRGNWRMELVPSTLHATSEHGVSSITTADAHTSAASSRINWRPRRFKWTRPFAERLNVVSARVPSHFKRSLHRYGLFQSPGWLSRHTDSLRAGRSGERIPMGARFFAPVQTVPGVHPASYKMGTDCHTRWWSDRAVALIIHPHLAPRLKNELEMYLYSPPGSSWPVIRWDLPINTTLFDWYTHPQVVMSYTRSTASSKDSSPHGAI
jgi:hypothetical protein